MHTGMEERGCWCFADVGSACPTSKGTCPVLLLCSIVSNQTVSSTILRPYADVYTTAAATALIATSSASTILHVVDICVHVVIDVVNWLVSVEVEYEVYKYKTWYIIRSAVGSCSFERLLLD